MFHADIIFVLALIALAAGAFLVFSTKANKAIKALPCAVIGYIIVVLSIVVILFSGYGMLRSYTMRRDMIPMMQQMMRGSMPTMQKPHPMMQQGQMTQGKYLRHQKKK